MRRGARIAAALACAVAPVSAALAAVSCVLTEPVDLPAKPHRHPTILHGAVAPPLSSVVSVVDGTDRQFAVPVQLDDPTQGYAWAVFIDYEPSLGATHSPIQGNTVVGAEGNADIQVINFGVLQSSLGPGCHRIELIVALSFVVPHVADPYGADSVSWFYSPAGDVSGCSIFEGGIGADGAFPPSADASPDGGSSAR